MNNIVYIVAINWDLQTPAIESWKYWCNKYNHKLIVINKPIVDVKYMSPHWQRYYIYQILDKKNIDYNKILYVDADAIVKWDAPNFFKYLETDNNLGVVKDYASLEWIQNGLNGYKYLFNNIELDWEEYFCTGFLLSTKQHKELYNEFLTFYNKNYKDFINLQYKTLKKGFDQTPFNLFCKLNNIKLQYLPNKFSLGSLNAKGILMNNMFINMGYIWQFNGVNYNIRKQIMNKTWNKIKDNYK
jgi:lipopolysaccharide biosynthesis glycosyltransferase